MKLTVRHWWPRRRPTLSLCVQDPLSLSTSQLCLTTSKYWITEPLLRQGGVMFFFFFTLINHFFFFFCFVKNGNFAQLLEARRFCVCCCFWNSARFPTPTTVLTKSKFYLVLHGLIDRVTTFEKFHKIIFFVFAGSLKEQVPAVTFQVLWLFPKVNMERKQWVAFSSFWFCVIKSVVIY